MGSDGFVVGEGTRHMLRRECCSQHILGIWVWCHAIKEKDISMSVIVIGVFV